jgi:hypothetical protein
LAKVLVVPPHKILDIPSDATREQIEEAYRRKKMYVNPWSFPEESPEWKETLASLEKLDRAYSTMISLLDLQRVEGVNDRKQGTTNWSAALEAVEEVPVFVLSSGPCRVLAFLIGLYQFIAVTTAVEFLTDFPPLISKGVGFVLSQLPLINSALAITGTVKVWNWNLVESLLFYLAIPLALYAYISYSKNAVRKGF